MKSAVEALFQNLITAVSLGMAQKTAAGLIPPAEAGPALSLLDALQKGRFHFEAEVWHDARENEGVQIYPAEMLLRARTQNNEPVKPLGPITTIAQAGLQAQLDKAIILAAIEQAITEKQMPISINTSARNMKSADFWMDVSQLLRDHFSPEDIQGQLTFEVLEDDLAFHPCREALLQMKKEFACKFAIDDFYHDHQRLVDEGNPVDSFDWARLENLKDIVDYIKIDGETVEAALRIENRFDLEALVSKIRDTAPHVHFVFERVKDADQAFYLARMGHAMQGRDLTNNRDDFKSALDVASQNFPPAPKPLKTP